jgi:peptide/nickel transport system permease protein
MKFFGNTFLVGPGWKHFMKNRIAKISMYFLGLLLCIAVFAPILANEKPLFASYNGEIFFPAFSFSNSIEITIRETGKKEVFQSNQVSWNELKPEKVLWAPVRYTPGKRDVSAIDYAAPSVSSHWLGTTKNGGDVLAGLIHGTRISLSIGILAMIIASFIGILLGSFAGYFGDHHLQASRGCSWMTVIGIIPAFFYGFYIRSNQLSEMLTHPGITIMQLLISVMIFISILFCFYKSGKLLNRISFFSKNIFIKVDSLVSRMIEVFISIPRLVLIITIAAIARPSFMNIIVIIGFTSWTEIARFVRAEFLLARNSEYVESARAIGLSDFRIILKHALPNSLAPAMVAIVFGIASAILIESGLSFLGIGVPQDAVTWGSLLFAGKENFEAWWLVIFPGLVIFLTITAINLVGDGLRDAMDVKGRVV